MAQALLRIAPHLTFEVIESRYKTCANGRNKTRWHLIWLMANPDKPLRITAAAQMVGYGEHWARILVGRYNKGGAEHLVDQRKHNKGREPILSKEQQDKLKKTLTEEKPDDTGLWTGPKVAAWITRETKTPITPQGAWIWLRRMSFTLQVPRPSHTHAATDEEQAAFKKKSRERTQASQPNPRAKQ